MTLIRFIIVAGVLITLGSLVPVSANSAGKALAASPFAGGTWEQKKKSDTPPPRPRPKAGPKDGGEDE